MLFSIKHKQKKDDGDEEIVIGLVEPLGVDTNNKKVVLHIKIYRTALKDIDGLSKSLCELSIRNVFKGNYTELEYPTQSKRFNIYLVKSNMGNKSTDLLKFASEMTIRLSDKIHELTNAK